MHSNIHIGYEFQMLLVYACGLEASLKVGLCFIFNFLYYVERCRVVFDYFAGHGFCIC